MEVAGLEGAAAAANGLYQQGPGLRNGCRVYDQAVGRAHEMSYDGGAWTIALAADRAKCWAYAEVAASATGVPHTDRLAPHWIVYDGSEWLGAPPGFRVSVASAGVTAGRRAPAIADDEDSELLPAGWEVGMSRSKNAPYYINTQTGETQWSLPLAPCVGTHEADEQSEELQRHHQQGGAALPLLQQAQQAQPPWRRSQRTPLRPTYSSGTVNTALAKVRREVLLERQRRQQAEAALAAELEVCAPNKSRKTQRERERKREKERERERERGR
eukprot:COSAG05_NODE_497_length_9246_cov_6.935343_13_plen_272_part_00